MWFAWYWGHSFDNYFTWRSWQSSAWNSYDLLTNTWWRAWWGFSDEYWIELKRIDVFLKTNLLIYRITKGSGVHGLAGCWRIIRGGAGAGIWFGSFDLNRCQYVFENFQIKQIKTILFYDYFSWTWWCWWFQVSNSDFLIVFKTLLWFFVNYFRTSIFVDRILRNFKNIGLWFIFF